MSVSLVSRNVARKLLLVQLLVVIASGLLFSLKDPFWGVSAISGGLAVFLPNVLFMIFAWRHQAHTPAKGRVAWTFAFGEAFKVLAMLVLLVVALVVLKAVFLPLIVTWVLVHCLQDCFTSMGKSFRLHMWEKCLEPVSSAECFLIRLRI